MFDSSIQAPLTDAGPAARQFVVLAGNASEAAPSRSEAQKIQAARAAVTTSEADFKALYDTHFRLVWCALSRLGVRDADLMDLTQKVFLTAYLKLPEFEGRSLLSTWLWGICRRVAIAYRRSSVIRYEVSTDPTNLEASSEHRHAGASEPDSTRQIAVDHILSKLSEPQRIVFTLFEVDELDGPEIAALLNISLGTVRSRLRYARKLFRREVQRLALTEAFTKKKPRP